MKKEEIKEELKALRWFMKWEIFGIFVLLLFGIPFF